MTIHFFQTLDAVLTQGISDICNVYRISEAEAVEKVQAFLAENSTQYFSDGTKLQYDDPLCRIAYLYAYVAAHANLIDNACYGLKALRTFLASKLENNEEIHICSFGGGPGSELLGFVKFFARAAEGDDTVDVHFTLVDSITEWDETWQALVNGIEATLRPIYGDSRRHWPVVIHRSFLPLNLTQVNNFRNLPTRFNGIELYVFNHTVSELLAHKDGFEEVFDYSVSHAQIGAYFLFIDRNQSQVYDWVSDLIERHEALTVVGQRTESTHMDRDEQKEDLGKWFVLMNRHPKLTWNAFFILAQKEPVPF